MTRGGRRNLLESQSTDKIIKRNFLKKKPLKRSRFFFSLRTTEHSDDLSSTHPLALNGAFTFSLFHGLLSYSDLEEKEAEIDALQPRVWLICMDNLFLFCIVF